MHRVTHQDILSTPCRQEDVLFHHSFVPNSTCRSKTKEWDIAYQINHLGMRDLEYADQKPADAYRILIVGDSFAEGFGVPQNQTYQTVLETKLNQNSRHLIEVLDAGVQSYSTSLEYEYLVKKGLTFQPDLVIVHLDLTDFSDEQKYASERTSTGWKRKPMFQDTIPSVTLLPTVSNQLKWWLHQHSQIYDLATNAAKKRLFPQKFPELISFHPGDPQTDSLVILRPQSAQQYQELLAPPEEYLAKIQQLLNRQHIPLLVIMPPHGLQLSAQEWSEGRVVWGFSKGIIYPTTPQKSIQEFAATHHITVVDFLSEFQQAENKHPGKLFYNHDGHFTVLGHQVVAGILFTFLQQHHFALE